MLRDDPCQSTVGADPIHSPIHILFAVMVGARGDVAFNLLTREPDGLGGIRDPPLGVLMKELQNKKAVAGHLIRIVAHDFICHCETPHCDDLMSDHPVTVKTGANASQLHVEPAAEY